MNHPVPDPIDEREWQAQEQAMRAARARAAGATGDGGYRAVAEAIVSTPLGAPPAGFAAAVPAELARRARRDRRIATLGFGLLAMAVLATSGAFSVPAWQALRAAVGGDASAWLSTIAGMAALSWACRQVLAMRAAGREDGSFG